MANLNTQVLEHNDDDGLQQAHQEHERLRTVTAFLVLGIVTNALYSLVISGAKDILAGDIYSNFFGPCRKHWTFLCCYINCTVLYAEDSLLCTNHFCLRGVYLRF